MTSLSNNDAYTVGSKSFTAVAINTAAKAGEWIKSKVGGYNKLRQKSVANDLVTEVDKGAEALIRNLIQTHFPHHAFLGEEGVTPGPGAFVKALDNHKDSEYLWIVDPIDGTTNFVHGYPYFSVSIALAYKHEVIVGVVYDPVQDEMFVAEKGKGAYLTGRRMEVSAEEKLADSLLATGFPTDRSRALPLNMRCLQRIAPQTRNIRSSGSAALHLAYVAAGRLSGFWEYGLSVWDQAAGTLLVKESGGTVTDTKGAAYGLTVSDVVATNGHIHDSVLNELMQEEAAFHTEIQN
ncbi:inositol monophosphatase family protein [Paenibacillus senegalensis]|uniref:inositol monophosphatase family protein n=1 Tax=Paenibacillus senegalensis TaxID=1465766 RepID=UPI00028858DD|nr:inositol monophosphatase family protein [Paenibacillus senegalensis]